MGGQGSTEGGGHAPDPLVVDVLADPDEVRVVVEGGLDRRSRQALHEAVWSAFGADRPFVIDLRGVTAADAAGVQGLLELWRIGVVHRFEHVPAVVRAVVTAGVEVPFADDDTGGAPG